MHITLNCRKKRASITALSYPNACNPPYNWWYAYERTEVKARIEQLSTTPIAEKKNTPNEKKEQKHK